MEWVLQGKPYEVQIEALRRAEGKVGWGHGLEMGLGKTAVALNEFFDLWLRKEVDILIVICPFTLQGTWKDQIQQWAHHFEPTVNMWPNFTTKWDHNSPYVYVLPYESVSVGGCKGQEFIDSMIMRGRRIFFVIEESIEIKNPTAVRTKYLIAKQPGFHIVRELCGYPIVGGPQDFWSQARAMGAPMGNYFSFRNRFCRMGGFKGKKVVGVRDGFEQEFIELMNEWFWIARKKDWTDLPEKMYPQPRQIDMGDEQRKHYRSMLQHFIVMLSEDQLITSQMVATQMNKLQQISSGFVYDESGNPHWLVKEPAKAKELVSILEQNSHTKFIVMCSYKPTVVFLESYLEKKGISVSVLAGKETMAALGRDFEIEKGRFNQVDDAQVVICQVNSTKYGLTLLGTEARPCYTTIYYENTYDLNARVQSEDRNHRHGQKYPVTYIDLACSRVELDAVIKLTTKRESADALLDPERAGSKREMIDLLKATIKEV